MGNSLSDIKKIFEGQTYNMHGAVTFTREDAEWLIEQAEILQSHAPEGRNYTNAQYVKLLQLNELLKKKVIELERLVTCPDCEKKLDWCECEEIFD